MARSASAIGAHWTRCGRRRRRRRRPAMTITAVPAYRTSARLACRTWSCLLAVLALGCGAVLGVEPKAPSRVAAGLAPQKLTTRLGGVGEVGTVDVGMRAVTVVLHAQYADTPIVFASVAHQSGKSVVARVYNKMGPCTPEMDVRSACSVSGKWEFDLALQSTERATCCGNAACCASAACCDEDICDVPHRVTFLALAPGALKHGTWQVGAVKAELSNTWYYMPFRPAFRAVPVVVTQLQTVVSSSLASTRQWGSTREGFMYMVHSKQPTTEVVGWFALTRGVGKFVDAFAYAAGTSPGGSGDSDAPLAKVNFGYRFSEFPAVFTTTNVWEALVGQSYTTGVLLPLALDHGELQLATESTCGDSAARMDYGEVNYIAIGATSPSAPCLNGATCLSTATGQQCDERDTTNIECHCSRGYSGARCEEDAQECASKPCAHGASCLESSIAGDVPLGLYSCTCSAAWSGSNCEEDVNECRRSTSCRHGGVCQNKPGGYACACRPGFTGAVCELDVDACESNPCFNDAFCNDGHDTYYCKCAPNFAGHRCQIDLAKDADECSSGPCLNGGSCVESNTDVTVRVGTYACLCTEGHSGQRCEIDTDECDSKPCVNGGECFGGLGFFRCFCMNGYSGLRCEIDIDECMSFPCVNAATCQHGPDSFKCICREGYSGADCSKGVDTCKSLPCQNGGTCVDLFPDYRCECVPGFVGSHCHQDQNECASEPCKYGATCNGDTVGTYSCACAQGFTGYNCDADVNECHSSPCANGGTCANNFQYYGCSCLSGYAGANCEIDVDECMSFPCLSGGKCIQSMHAYTCVCRSGYSGENCAQNVNECASSPCENKGKCEDKPHTYVCTCVEGWAGVNCGSPSVDTCAHCDPEYARCFRADEADEMPVCKCLSGYSTTDGGKNCLYMDVCHSHPCEHDSTCTDYAASYECLCAPGYSGEHCENDIDECASKPCENGSKCNQYVGGFVCGDPTVLTLDLDIDPETLPAEGSEDMAAMQDKLARDLAKSLGVDPRRVRMVKLKGEL